MNEFPLEFSPTLGKLAKALAAAQGELKDAVKDTVNPHFKSKFASLASIRAAVIPVFSKHGLAVTQLSEPHGDGGVCVITMLIHADSGEWLRSKLYVPVSKKDAQGFGSALSYARRYALAMIANIATDDDDDGNEAVKPPGAKSPEKPKEEKKSSVDVKELLDAMAAAQNTEELAKAILAVGRVKEKLSKEDLDKCSAARANRLRELEAA